MPARRGPAPEMGILIAVVTGLVAEELVGSHGLLGEQRQNGVLGGDAGWVQEQRVEDAALLDRWETGAILGDWGCQVPVSARLQAQHGESACVLGVLDGGAPDAATVGAPSSISGPGEGGGSQHNPEEKDLQTRDGVV